MLDNIPILSIITFFPLVGVLVLIFMPSGQGRWIRFTAVATTLVPLILSLWLYADFNHQNGQMQYLEDMQWIHIALNHESGILAQATTYFFELHYKMAVDGLSLALVILTALISTMAALAAVHIKKRWKAFYIFFLILQSCIFGVFMARDLILFFIFFEVSLVPAFFLIGIWGYKDREKAANQFLLYNGIGSALLLIGFLILINTAGFMINQPQPDIANVTYTADLEVIGQNLTDPQSFANAGDMIGMGIPNPFHLGVGLKWFVFILLLVAFAIKFPIFPFHTWMLKVHAEAPPSVVMIHSGLLLKIGAYGIIRFVILLFPEQSHDWALILAILGVVNILYGAVLAFRQTDFKLVLAYSSISHMGIVLLGIAALNAIGMEGAIFQMISHGLISALLFLMVGSIYERTSTTTLNQLGGLAKTVPFMSGILLFAGLASLGLPGLSGFISEFLAFLGLFESMEAMTIIGMIGIILAAVYVLRGVLRITYGPKAENLPEMKDARLVEAVPMIILVAFILLIGIYPSVLSDPLQHTVGSFLETISMKVGG